MDRILLVEDVKTTALMYKDYLEKNGYTVVVAYSAEEAIDFLLKENFSLIISDIMMAKMSGWELVEYVRKKLNKNELELPIIVMSAFESAELEFNCYKFGANAWITKPIHPLSKLLKSVDDLLGKTKTTYHLLIAKEIE